MIYITLYEDTDLFVNKQRLLGIPELIKASLYFVLLYCFNCNTSEASNYRKVIHI